MKNEPNKSDESDEPDEPEDSGWMAMVKKAARIRWDIILMASSVGAVVLLLDFGYVQTLTQLKKL